MAKKEPDDGAGNGSNGPDDLVRDLDGVRELLLGAGQPKVHDQVITTTRSESPTKCRITQEGPDNSIPGRYAGSVWMFLVIGLPIDTMIVSQSLSL
jgi:hypothetical protein